MKKYKIYPSDENDFFLINIRKTDYFSLRTDIDLFKTLEVLDDCSDLEFFDSNGNKFKYFSFGMEIICKNKEEFEKILKNLEDINLFS